MSGIGLAVKWECATCGNLITTKCPAWNVQVLKATIQPPTRCVCGRVAKFNIVGFKQIYYTVEEKKEEGVKHRKKHSK